MRIAVYPGSFDPITLGHMDVIRRATEVFDRVIVAVVVNPRKSSAHSGQERVDVILEAVREAGLDTQDRVQAIAFEGLTVDLARAAGARHIVRGLRAISDFDVELQMSQLNRRMAPDLDTLVFMTGAEHGHLSSTFVREIASLGGDVSGMVPGAAIRMLRRTDQR